MQLRKLIPPWLFYELIRHEVRFIKRDIARIRNHYTKD